MRNGYQFMIDNIVLPIAPPSMEVTIGSRNETIELINDGEVSILKSPSLVEVSFEARFPMRVYPFAPSVRPWEEYWDKLRTLKEEKKSFYFMVARTFPDGRVTWNTNLLVSLEEITLKEDAEEGDDVLVDITLKQFKPYGTYKYIPVAEVGDGEETIVDTDTPREEKTVNFEPENTGQFETYTVKDGDTLWGIAQHYYGDGSYYPVIYRNNSAVIESEAQAHGMQSSSNGRYLWSGLQLNIPDISGQGYVDGGV